MKRGIVIILFTLLISAGCAIVTGKDADVNKTDTEYEQVLTLSDFTDVQIGMKYDDVVKCVGSPTGSKGSGIVWQTYQFADG